jgi:lipopolysaccharide/colanic/teichoic acid biosynthesis glycosyltransferase
VQVSQDEGKEAMAAAKDQQVFFRADLSCWQGRSAIEYADPPKVPSYFRWKGAFDRVAAAILLVPSLPLIGILALVMRLSSGGSGIFRQVRVGRDGKLFTLLKIRTMAVDAEDGSGAVWATDRDPRITRIGWLLRKFHLDELPQLLNVIRGEMSLVGPRPERPEFVEVLQEVVPGYSNRLLVPPGVTGLAQLNLPPDTNLCCVCRKLALDLDYVHDANLWMDFRVIACTIARLPKLPGLTLLRLFRLERTPNIEHCPLGQGNGHAKPTAGAAQPANVAPESLQCSVIRRVNGHNADHLLPVAGSDRGKKSQPPAPKPR